MMTDAREELRKRVRNDRPPAQAAVVIRGGPDTPSLLRTHARRLNRLYMLDGEDVFGVSVFVARDEIGPASVRFILGSKLQSYPTIYRTTVGQLTALGFEVLATFTSPHFTVVMPTLDRIDDLATAFGRLVPNPYAGGSKETP
jgi:hypothetical protein